MAFMSISNLARQFTHTAHKAITIDQTISYATRKFPTQINLHHSFSTKDTCVISKKELLHLKINLKNFPNLQNDEEVVLALINRDGTQLENASPRLRNKITVVSEAVKQNGWALQYASRKLKNNDDVVKAAVSNNGYAIRYASRRLRNDPEIGKIAVQQYGLYVMKYLGPTAQKALWEYAADATSERR